MSRFFFAHVHRTGAKVLKKPRKAGARVSDPTPIPLATSGEIFADGSAIELVRKIEERETVSLLLWHDARVTIAPVVKHKRRFYRAARIDRSILRELTLPTHSSPHASTRDLLRELSKQAVHLVGLPEKFASLVGRAVLDSWIIRALPVAPVLAITGPHVSHGNRLLQWLHCVCRHPLRMSEVIPAALCSLPSAFEFTLLITQPNVSDTVRRLLDGASRPDQKMLRRGRLLDLYGLQVVHSTSGLSGGSWSSRSVQIPMLPTNQPLPIFNADVQNRISAEFQPKLLGYRLANYGSASTFEFDASPLTHSLRELAHSFAAATPHDSDLQAEVFELLREEDLEIRSGRWVDFTAIVIESLNFACREWHGQEKYVADLAEVATEIWRGRGVNDEVDAGAYGKRIKLLGFLPEPRDAKGVKLRITGAVCSRAQQLHRELGVPEPEGERG
jgi:hypothetical protein